jgi:MFS family permease
MGPVGHPPEGAVCGSKIVYRGWYVVFGCFLMAVVAWGIGFYGPAVFLLQLRAAHAWSTALLSAATTFYHVCGAILAIFVADVIARFGVRLIAVTGIAALCLALVVLLQITAPWQLFAAYFLMAVGWAATSWTAIPIIPAPWFLRRRGLAISLAFMGGKRRRDCCPTRIDRNNGVSRLVGA